VGELESYADALNATPDELAAGAWGIAECQPGLTPEQIRSVVVLRVMGTTLSPNCVALTINSPEPPQENVQYHSIAVACLPAAGTPAG
jgi:hypothetical protein